MADLLGMRTGETFFSKKTAETTESQTDTAVTIPLSSFQDVVYKPLLSVAGNLGKMHAVRSSPEVEEGCNITRSCLNSMEEIVNGKPYSSTPLSKSSSHTLEANIQEDNKNFSI